MRFRWSCCRLVFGLIFLLQQNDAAFNKPNEENLLVLQLKVENLIEKIINYIQEYYYSVKEDVKCIPDCAIEDLMGTLKKSIDCVENNEVGYSTGLITEKTHSKNFLKCFSTAKAEVRDVIASINTTLDYCPDSVTEKTYQINVTTTFTKTFNIDIKNGLEITKKQIELDKVKHQCFDHRLDEGEYSDYDEDDDDNEGLHVPVTEENPDEEKKTTFSPEEKLQNGTEDTPPGRRSLALKSSVNEFDEDEDNQRSIQPRSRSGTSHVSDEENGYDDREQSYSRYVYLLKQKAKRGDKMAEEQDPQHQASPSDPQEEPEREFLQN